jgi:ubiquinone biosynthesis protein COQ9
MPQRHNQVRSLSQHPSPRNNTTRRRSSHSPTKRCDYHSHFHPRPPTHEYTNSQTAILTAALKHVPDHGFTKETLTLGARDMGFLDVSIQLFTRQEIDLVLFWLASRRGLLRAKVENGLFENQRAKDSWTVEEKVKTLVLERLRMNEKIVHRWQDVSFPLSLHSLPPQGKEKGLVFVFG